MRNGYFQIIENEDEFGILLKPPVDGGEEIRFEELDTYLREQELEYDYEIINMALSSGDEEYVRLGMGPCPAIRTGYDYEISEDEMEVIARFFAPSETGRHMDADDFVFELHRAGVKYGICEDAIKKALKSEYYCTDIVVAKGDPVREGTDARIEYYFNTDPRVKPTINEDGSVDFFHLNTINNCKTGDILARLFKEDGGDIGMSVKGTSVHPRKVKREVLRYGLNIEVEEDGCILRSKVDGHVTLVDGKVFVSDVLELENVDNSTGNIDFEGSVNIAGNVQSNFTVRAGGDIIVKGIVEAAKLESGGDIILTRGMVGMGKGSLKARGNVVAKFFENTTIDAGGYVRSESSLHSVIRSGAEIVVDGKKGFISGGKVCATDYVEAKTLGSHLGTVTIIEVGATPEMKDMYVKVQNDIKECSKVLAGIDPVVKTFSEKRKKGIEISMDQMKYLYSLLKIREEKFNEMKELMKVMDKLHLAIKGQDNAYVAAKGDVFPGVKVCIGEVSMAVENSVKYCKFQKIRGDVKISAL